MGRGDDLDTTRVRELLLDFYQKHDPERLAAGLDVFSMVVWTQANGLDALNEMLEDQYGARIDPRKNMGGSQQAFNRFSIMVAGPGSGPSKSDAALRSQLRTKLFAFYEEHDPARTGRLPDFVDYIMLHGLSKFNKKLVSKYGRGIELDAGFAPPQPKDRTLPKKMKAPPGAPPPPPMSEDGYDDLDEDMVPPPPPPPPEDGGMSPDEQDRLESQLRAFYSVHDPPKLEHIGAIMEWGQAIGAEELEAKLIQIYGAGFEDSDVAGNDWDDDLTGGPVDEEDDRDSWGASAGPPPPPARSSPPKSTGLGSKLRASVRNVFGGGGGGAVPSRPKPQPPTPPAAVSRKASATQKPAAPRLPKPKKPSFSTGVQFEGLPASAKAPVRAQAARTTDWPPRTQRSKPTPPKAPSFTGSMSGAVQRTQKPAPPPGASKWGFASQTSMAGASRDDSNSDVPCTHYELDLTGAGFGMCKCGFPRLAHVKGGAMPRGGPVSSARPATRAKPNKPTKPRAPMGMEPREATGTFLFKTTAMTRNASKADFVAGGGEKGGDRACNRFQLDMEGNSYGVCECGFKRDQHRT